MGFVIVPDDAELIGKKTLIDLLCKKVDIIISNKLQKRDNNWPYYTKKKKRKALLKYLDSYKNCKIFRTIVTSLKFSKLLNMYLHRIQIC